MLSVNSNSHELYTDTFFQWSWNSCYYIPFVTSPHPITNTIALSSHTLIHSSRQIALFVFSPPCVFLRQAHRPEFAFDSTQQTPRCSSSVSYSSSSKQPSQPPSASSNTASGPSSPPPRNRIWENCTFLTLFSVSQDLFLFPYSFSIGEGKRAEAERVLGWRGLLILNGQPR